MNFQKPTATFRAFKLVNEQIMQAYQKKAAEASASKDAPKGSMQPAK